MVTTVPVASLQPGFNAFTASSAFDYGRWASPQNVYVQGQNGWQPLQQGQAVQPGQQFQVYTAQAGAVTGAPPPGTPGISGGSPGSPQESVTGQDLVWQNHQITMDIANAQSTLRQLDQTDASLAQQAEIANAQLQNQRDIAQMNAQQNAASIGVQAAQVELQARLADINAQQQAADLNFRQRTEAVSQARQDAQLNLQAAQTRVSEGRMAADLNFNQRSTKANLEQNAMGMLADRSGPQDWVKYNALLNNMNSANPQASSTVDPFSLLADLYQEYTPDMTGLEGDYQSDMGGLVQQHTPQSSGGAWQQTLSAAQAQANSAQLGGGGITGGAPQVGIPGGTSYSMDGGTPAQGQGQVQGGAGGGLPTTSGQSIPYGNDQQGGQIPSAINAQLDTNAASMASGKIDPVMWNPGTGPAQSPSGGSSVSTAANPSLMEKYYAAKGYADGGYFPADSGHIALVGDDPNRRTGNEEALVPMGNGVMILPNKETQSLLDGGQQGLVKMYGGGIVGTNPGAGYDPNAVTYNLYDDATLYGQPFLKKIRGEQPGRQFGAIGGGNRVGPYDLPTNLSLQRWGALSPTEQAMTQGAYDDPRAGVNFDDIMAGAQRASVGTRGFGGLAAYA